MTAKLDATGKQWVASLATITLRSFIGVENNM